MLHRHVSTLAQRSALQMYFMFLESFVAAIDFRLYCFSFLLFSGVYAICDIS